MRSFLRTRPGSLLLGTLVALACAAPATAALYKWVDANGRTVYSDQPPSGNVKSEIVGAAAPAANPDAVKDMANKEAEFRKRQMDKVEDAKKAEKARADAQRLAGFCSQARAQVAGLRRSDVAMHRLNDKGERVLLDEAQRRAEAERLEALIKERNCPPAPPG
jgi:Skp family chaperone for outer membrane proteins